MIIDLVILSIIGLVLEGVATFLLNYALSGAAPTTVLSLLIVLLAVSRWGWKGLIVIPFCALGNFIGGQLMLLNIRDSNGELVYVIQYDWKVYVSVIVGLLSCFVYLIYFKISKSTNKGLKSKLGLGCMLALNFVVFELLRTSSYYLIGGNQEYITNGMLYNLTALVILFIGAFLLRSQKVLINVKEKLIDDKKRAELEKEAEEAFDKTGVAVSDEN